MVEFRQLKYFIAVAEELHFGRAAESLHLSQPALSKQIQALEDSLEIQLFERTKHWVKLTPSGQKFLETARRILHQVEEGIQVTRQVADGQSGRVRVGFTEATLFSLAPKIFSTYRRYPQVNLILSSGGTESHVEQLRTHQIDVGFVYLPIREPTLAVLPLYEETYIAAMSASHPLAKQERLSIQSLANYPLIGYPHLSAQGVVYRPLSDDFPKLKLAVAWRQNESLSVVHEFIKVLKTTVSSTHPK